MNPESLQQVCASILRHIAEPAARSLALGCFAAGALAVLRMKNVALRLTAWKAVLCVALAMPLLGWLVPALPFSMPVPRAFRNAYLAVADRSEPMAGKTTRDALSVKQADAIVGSLRGKALHQDSARPSESGQRANSQKAVFAGGNLPTHQAAEPAHPSNSWLIVCALLYFAVALFLLARIWIGIELSRRLIRSSLPIREPRALASFTRHAAAFEFSATPRLAESERISVPVTMGVLDPIILFPAEWRDWDDEELSAVLAHELSHCARHDALVQRFALLHRAIFWFSPLSWWLNLHIAELAEEASDEAVLASGADRAEYAGTLLNFFAALQANSGRVWWQGMSMAKCGMAERRVDRILAWKGTVSMNLNKSFVFAILVVATPVVFVAAAVRPTGITSASPTAPQSAPAPAARPSGGVIAPIMLPPPSGGVKAPPMSTPPSGGVIAPAMQAPPETPVPGQSNSEDSSKSTIYVFGGKGHDAQRVRIESGSCDIVGSSEGGVIVVAGDTCTATDFDGEDAPSLQAKITEHAIEFRRDGKKYVVRDQTTVDRAKKLFAPIFALSEKQSELGKQQSALGEKQSELGRQMSEVRVKMPDLTAELKAVEAKMRELRANGGTQSELGELQSELGEMQSKIGEIESSAGEQQGKIGEKQGKLGEQQGKLGEMQGKLGEEQGEASKKAARELKKLLEDAFALGSAKPE